MGNTAGKERGVSPPNGHSAGASSSGRHGRHNGESSHSLSGRVSLLGGDGYSTRSRSRSNLEHSLFGLGGTSQERRERDREAEKQAREERRAAREAERLKERERSLREDRVDGGFLVTQGVYTGVEDFKDKIVRQLMLERRLAPFWKGMSDHEDDWTDAQLVAAAHGKPIPPADAKPPVESTSKPVPSKSKDSSENLTVPLASRSRAQSYTSDASNRSNTSTPSFGFSSRARSKTIQSISAPKNPVLPTPVAASETNNPSTFVDGRPIEAVLYKNAIECPICFLYYPPHLNKTRCCDQEICSECFVQIKRAEPHLPEHHDGPPTEEEQAMSHAEQLISEPATCPFCKQPDFGVVYTPPPFRRGLVLVSSLTASNPASSNLSNSSSATSLPGKDSSPPISPDGTKRRATFTKDAPEVVTTDRIRPDWAQKLHNARSHAARRAAAATALHTAAFMMNAPSSGGNSSGGFSGRRILRRHRGDNGSESPSPGVSSSGTPPRENSSSNMLNIGTQTMRERPRPGGGEGGSSEDRLTSLGFLTESRSRNGRGNLLEIAGAGSGTRENRRSRMVDLEEMMLMEAIRLSLAEEEERKNREEAAAAEKAAKEEELAEKNRRLREATVPDGGESSVSAAISAPVIEGKGKSVDRSTSHGEASGSLAAAAAGPSSSCSSNSSFASVPETGDGGASVTPDYFAAHASGSQTPENAGSAEESMFNFRSLAEMIEEEEAAHANNEKSEDGHVEHVEHHDGARDGVAAVVAEKNDNVNCGCAADTGIGKSANVTMERVGDETSA